MLKTLWQAAGMGPGICQVCGRWPAQPICDGCVRRFGTPRMRCITCAAPLSRTETLCGACQTRDPSLALCRCVAAMDYAYPWDNLIARFKFRDGPGWARPLAQLMSQASDTPALLRSSDWLVPVPLSPGRLASRGYNQAWELVKALRALQPDSPPGLANALVRLGDAPDQHSLPREQRLRNLRGAFAAHPDHVARLLGRKVLLVDDVSTTGATLRSAAFALRQAGAAQVQALVIARTLPH